MRSERINQDREGKPPTGKMPYRGGGVRGLRGQVSESEKATPEYWGGVRPNLTAQSKKPK